jgi:hypothetical protein
MIHAPFQAQKMAFFRGKIYNEELDINLIFLMTISTLSDQELFKLCREYGAKALSWRRKFIGLLPEVNRRQLYKLKGFSSIFEFAAKLCGLSEQQVRRALSLDKRFEQLPTLRSLLINGEESVNKLAKIASIATRENEVELAEQIKVLPVRAVETLVRDEKSVHVNTQVQQKLVMTSDGLQLSEEVKEKLLELQQKGIDVNVLILEMLEKREADIEEEKEKIAEYTQLKAAPSRYIPARIRKILKQEYGEKCSIVTCQKQAKVIHHTQRFALSHSHNPKFLAPLCSEHHVIAHSIDIKMHRVRESSQVSPLFSSSPSIRFIF